MLTKLYIIHHLFPWTCYKRLENNCPSLINIKWLFEYFVRIFPSETHFISILQEMKHKVI